MTKATAPKLHKYLTEKGKAFYDMYLVSCTKVFSDFIETSLTKCEYVKNIIYRDEPVPLLSQYVGNSFKASLGGESDSSVLRRVERGPVQALVVGHAGSGKSMFMRWLTIMLATDILSHKKIPVYVELRNLSITSLRENEILEIIFSSISSHRTKSDLDQFKLGFEYGQFIILLDGIDEVSPSVRDSFLLKLQNLLLDYPKASIICSTRPDIQVESITKFSVLRLNCMKTSQIIQVISKARFDSEKKQAFINKIRVGSFRKQEDILSNPLIALIMLIAFDDSNDIPEKATLFYAQIYIALFYKHDASKGVYKRDRFTTLNEARFSKGFEWFSFLSYAISRFRFDESALYKLIETSLKKAKVYAKVENYIKDCKQSLSLLQDDGLDTIFVHRSFQEYFTAKYLHSYDGNQYANILDSVALRAHTDNVLSMLLEMGPSAVKRRWVIPRLTEHHQQLSDIDFFDAGNVAAYMSRYYNRLTVKRSDSTIANITWPSLSGIAILSAALGLVDSRYQIRNSFSATIFGNKKTPFARSIRDSAGTSRDFLRIIETSFTPLGDDLLAANIGHEMKAWVLHSNIPSCLLHLRSEIAHVLELLNQEVGEDETYMAKLAETMQQVTRT